MNAIVAALRSQFGEAQVLTGEAALPFERDWRGQFPGRSLAVLRPRSVAELQAMLRASQPLPIVAQGGNTGLVGGSTADAGGGELIVSLRRLDRVRALSATELTLSAEAGCTLQSLQQAAEQAGLLLPLSMASEGSCTLGGNLATNAGGTQVLAHGNARDLCLGLELVSADGELFSDMAGLRKDHRGLNLRDLFIGSEGCLGLITAAVMRLQPLPRSRLAAWVLLADIEAALALLQRARHQLGESLSGFELMAEPVQRLLPGLPLPAAPWAVLLEMSSALPEALAREIFEQLLADQQAALALSQAQFDAMWRLRESIPAAQPANLKHDISLPIAAIAGFVAETEAAIAAAFPGAQIFAFGHLGDGNLHYNVAVPGHREHEAAMNRLVFDAVARHGGSFSAEHGIGRLRRAELAAHGDPQGLALMRRIKLALDPAGRLNPGRLLPD